MNRQLDYVELKKIGIISESQKRSYHYFAEGKSEVEATPFTDFIFRDEDIRTDSA